MKTLKVPVGSTTLKLYDLGGSGAPVLFSHAASFCGMMWLPVIEKLGLERRIFVVDMRGHGQSVPLEPTEMRWDSMAHDLVEVVDNIKDIVGSKNPIDVVGHSMGGTTLLMAELLNPGLVASLWAFEPILFANAAPERKEVTQMLYEGTLRRKPNFASKQAAKERFLSKPPMDSFAEQCVDLFIEYGLYDSDGLAWLSCRPEVEAQIYLGSGTGVTAKLEEIDFPVRFVVGQDDGDRVPAILGFAATQNTDVEMHPELGHFGPFVAPDLMAKSITAWLTQNQ